MVDEAQITMTSIKGFALVMAVAFIYLAVRLLPRLLLGFKAYLSPEKVVQLMQSDDQVLLLDVRSSSEFSGELGHIPKALNVPLNQLKSWSDNAAEIQQLRHVILVCRTDARAAFAGRILRRAGFTRVSVLSGGMTAWVDDSRSVEMQRSTGQLSNLRGSGEVSRKQNP